MNSTNHFGIPGIGGSLGTCALCGKPFVTEIILGNPVQSFSVGGCNQRLYGHDKCLADLKTSGRLDVLTLPKESPLRQAYERQSVETGEGFGGNPSRPHKSSHVRQLNR